MWAGRQGYPGDEKRLLRRPWLAHPTGGPILSTWPASLANNCAVRRISPDVTYCYAQGTSMASPHVAGVAALVVSTGVTSLGAVAARITGTADPMPCPTDANFPALDNGAPQVRQAGPGYNGFNGHGLVNALRALGR